MTVDGTTRKLADSFFVIATQNPLETTGTFPLPEAQLDRFFMKLSMGLPDEKEELKILNRFLTEAPYESLEPVCSCQQVAEAGVQVRQVYVHPQLLEYMVKLVQATRDNREIRSGVSPRGTLALLHAAQAFGWLDGRTFVVPEDVKAVAVPVMAHRLVLSRGYGSSVTGEDRIREILEKVPVPVEE